MAAVFNDPVALFNDPQYTFSGGIYVPPSGSPAPSGTPGFAVIGGGANFTPQGMFYGEYYLYSKKAWQMASFGQTACILNNNVLQNAPIVITSSGAQVTSPADPFARCDGDGKYTKVGFGNFTTLPNGLVDTTKYEFALHPQASGLIVFASQLRENVYIEYESGPSSYYTFTDVDLNPMVNDFNGGFIAFSQEEEPVSINMSATNYILTANGAQKTNILATVLDSNNDPCPNQQINFTIPNAYISYLEPIGSGVITQLGFNGKPVEISNITNGRGQARVAYWPVSGQTGAQVVTASWASNRNVFGYVVITQSYSTGAPFRLDTAASGSYPGTYATNWPQQFYALPSGVTASNLDSSNYLT